MTTVYVDRDSISLKTRSRSGCSPQHFIILKKELQRLEEKKYLITKDIHSYAELRLCDAVGGAKVLEFHSRKNLKAVVENPILRHKLGKFLDQHFNWYNYERIVLTDDYLPYSFFFEGYMVQGTKTCGGVILHGEEDIQTAKYGIHT